MDTKKKSLVGSKKKEIEKREDVTPGARRCRASLLLVSFAGLFT
jgi:hypothetical protein